MLKEGSWRSSDPSLAQSLALGGNPPLAIRLPSSLLASHHGSLTAGIREGTLEPLSAAPRELLSQLVQTKAGRRHHGSGGEGRGGAWRSGIPTSLDFLSNAQSPIAHTRKQELTWRTVACLPAWQLSALPLAQQSRNAHTMMLDICWQNSDQQAHVRVLLGRCCSLASWEGSSRAGGAPGVDWVLQALFSARGGKVEGQGESSQGLSPMT